MAAARIVLAFALASIVNAVPASPVVRNIFASDVYDVEAHRGGRGETIENTLPAFAQALIEGATTLEMDNGITKDGVVVVWHDEQIVAEKCTDTKPVVANDPLFPYVGKYIANLTFAQLSTLDCGSKRLDAFPIQITVPKTRIASQKQVFDMVSCADPTHRIHWNIESKVNPNSNVTVSAEEFVKRQRDVFSKTAYYKKKQIVYQSFDWRTIRDMAKIDKYLINSALVDSSTLFNQNGSYLWLANLDIDSFPGATLQEKAVYAAQSIGSKIISPGAYDGFVTKAMVDAAHKLKLDVVPWTVNNLTLAQELYDLGVDGIISDYPHQLWRWAKHEGLKVGSPYSESIVTACLKKYT